MGKPLTYDDIPYEDEASISLVKEGKTMGFSSSNRRA
jgi:hypothetical protein